jgi:hypothetical protein
MAIDTSGWHVAAPRKRAIEGQERLPAHVGIRWILAFSITSWAIIAGFIL